MSLIQSIKKYFTKKQELRYFQNASIEDVFTTIYDKNKWGDEESRSGKGSSLTRTIRLREQLPQLLADLQVKSMLDIPCGDMFWLRDEQLPVERYTGADIVETMVAENQQRYSNDQRTFMTLDLVKDELPAVDLIMCRECLVHFSFDHIAAALANLEKTDFRYLLITHFPDQTANVDIVTGKHRMLNLTLPPFSWPEPERQIVELDADSRRGRKCLSLWSKATLFPSR